MKLRSIPPRTHNTIRGCHSLRGSTTKKEDVGYIIDNRKHQRRNANSLRKMVDYQIELLEEDLKEIIKLGDKEGYDVSEYIKEIRKRIEVWKSLIGGD